MRRPAARPGGGHIFGDRIGHFHSWRAIGDNGHRFIAETEDQALFVQEFPPWHHRAALTPGASHGHGVGQGGPGDGLGERLALGVVAIEKRLVRRAAEWRGDLPRQIVNVLEAGVETEAAGRRHLMGGVSGQENRAVAEAVGNNGGSLPGTDAQHRYRQLRNADSLPDQRRATLRREILRPVTVLARAVDQEAPAVRAVDGQECTPQFPLLDKVERGPAMFGPLPEVGAEQDVDAVVYLLFPYHSHAQRAADAALRALRGDEIARGKWPLLAGHTVS